MASVRALLLAVVLPPLAVLLAVAVVRAAARGVSALARAHFAWPAGSPFMYVPARRKHARKVALEQREHELRVSLYGKREEEEEEEAEAVECMFCLSGVEEGDEVRELRCGHLFHRACLDRWLARPAATCPLCRCGLLKMSTSAAARVGASWDSDTDGEDSDSDSDSDSNSEMVLLMAYASSSSWFWSP